MLEAEQDCLASGRPTNADADASNVYTPPSSRLWQMAWQTATPTTGQSLHPLIGM